MAVAHKAPPGSAHAGETTAARALPVVLRVMAGLLWLSNVDWKVPPEFGKSGGECGGLCGFVQAGADHGPPGWSWLMAHVVLPNLTAFGYATLLIEVALAVLLLSGTLTRGAALAGAAQSLVIGLSVANAPGEWYWSYVLMVALHLAVYSLAAGRTYGVDAVLRRRPGRSRWLEALT
ncbi:MAG: TQO small subunit DoxD [Acidimicrobiales bacterium]